MTASPDYFPTDVSGLPTARSTDVVELAHGDEFELRIAPIAKELGQTTVRMLAYNGAIPGPTLRVHQGSELVVNVVNEGDLEATVHWHGLRLDNRYDGTHLTQEPIPVGGSFTYRLAFPDPGVYWYHPHIREDYGQEMGLYGNIVVVPADPGYWSPVNREIAVTLDDVLVEDGKLAPFSRSETTFSAMGRYGNVLLINGEAGELSLAARLGEVVRFYFTDTANSRVFRLGLHGARMKLVGGDSGRYEHEQLVDDVVVAPSERVVVDVLFDQPGEVTLEHRTPERAYRLATVNVTEEPAAPAYGAEFGRLRRAAEFEAERERLSDYVAAEPDKTLALVAEMDLGEPALEQGVYVCPMHSEIIASWAGKCPKCGMKLLPAAAEAEPPSAFACPMDAEVTATWGATCPKCGMTLRPTGVAGDGDAPDAMSAHQGGADEHGAGHGHGTADGIEWEDDMLEVNRTTTPASTRWKLVDRASGAEGHAIEWRFRVGDRVKIRLVNEMESDHPMHHPFHIHGAGRFLILARNGVVEPNLVWKDTVLVPTGHVVDLLLDVTNPGRWMAHCHIAEHHESGMMFPFDVDE